MSPRTTAPAVVGDLTPEQPLAPPVPPTRTSERRSLKASGSYRNTMLILALPALALYVFVVIIPSVRGAVYAFTDWNGLDPTFKFVGLDNFVYLFTTPRNVRAILITLIIAAVATVLQNLFGLLLALGVNTQIKSRNFLRVLLFAPAIVIPVVAAYLFKYIFAPDGPLNEILGVLGLEGVQQNWLGEPTPALISIIVLVLWRGAGYSMVIFLAGLQSIPEEVIEAATLDGAGPWQRFRYIIRFLLAPATTIAVMLSLIQTLMVFPEVWVLTEGGPGTATDTISTAIYKNAFIWGDFSAGVAMAVILFVLVATISAFQYRTMLKGEKH